ncbi:Putative SCY1 protein kinase [Rhizopus microsporus]|nr:Putative SCY1 protein kinase [Rhizopus microsporus]
MSSAFYSFINSITNSITSKYDIKSQISTSGLWKIYKGERKTTGKKVALFIFEKKTLDSGSFKRDKSRHDTDVIYDLLKKEAGNLARLRHPSILEVVEPVSESRSSIVFVTEPLIGCLTHLVKSSDSYSSESIEQNLDLDELEIQKGLLQVGKGLQFLNDAKVVHHNLTTDAIFVNAKGDWKIGGLGFSIFLNSETTPRSHDNSEFLPEACQINLDYAAPEFILDNNICQANDMFSLGCLAYAVHNKGISLLKTFNNYHSYEKQVKTINSQSLSNMPHHLQQVLSLLLAKHPNQRMTPTEFQNSKYFDNLLVSTIRFLESFPEKTKEEKAQFMKGLAKVLGQFPERVIRRKILPSLLEELKNSQLLPYTIPNVFIISQRLTQHEFCELVLPSLKPVFLVRDPPQNMIVLLEKLDILQSKTTRETFRDDVMPLVYAALESPTNVVQERALRMIPSLSESLDYTTVKSSLFPRVQAVFAQTTILSVKVSTLICFHSMIKVLDKFTIQEKLLPSLKNIKTKEPAVMLATLAVYDEIGKTADKEIIATEILPQLWKMSFGPLLNLEQFQKFIKTIRDLTDRVEEAHIKHLREVKSLEEQTKSVSSSPQVQNVASDNVNFESLVQGSSTLAANKVTEDDFFGKMTAGSSSVPASPKKATWSSSSSSSALLIPSNATNSNVNKQQTAASTSTWSMPVPALTPSQAMQSNGWKPVEATTTTMGWNTLQIKPPPQQNTTSNPLLPMNQIPMNNSSRPNYSAFKELQSSNTAPSIPTLQPSSMSVLQPTIASSNSSSMNTTQRKIDIHAFDPLG